MSDVSRSVTLTLKVVADAGNSKAVSSVDKAVADSVKKQVAEQQKGLDAAAKANAAAVRDAEKRYDKEAAEALKMYSKILREREKSAAAAEKAAAQEAAAAKKSADAKVKEEQRASAAAQKAYDQQVKEAQAAYAKILRSQEQNARAYEQQAEKAQEFGRKSAKAGTQVLGSAIGVAEGFAKLGLTSEETTEAMLKGLLQVQGGFQIIRELVMGYDDLKDMIQFATKSLHAQNAAQELLNSTTMKGIVLQKAGAAAAGVGAGKAAGSLATGGAAAAGGTAAGAGGTAVTTAASGITAASVAAGASLVALAALIAYVGQEIGASLGLWESLTGSIVGWRKAAADAAESTRKVEKSERGLELVREMAARRNEQHAAMFGRVREAQSFRSTLTDLRSSLPGVENADDYKRTQYAKELEASKARLSGLVDQRNREMEVPKGLADNSEKKRTWGGWMVGQEAQNKGESRTWAGWLAGQEDPAKKKELMSVNSGFRANKGVEEGQKDVLEQQQRLVEIDRQRYQNSKALAETQRQNLQSLKEQAAESIKLVQAEKQRYQSALATVGALTDGERKRAAAIAAQIKDKGVDSLTKGQIQFAQSKGLFANQIEAKYANKAASTAEGRAIAEMNARTEKPSASVEAAAMNSEAVKAADFARMQASEAVHEAEQQLEQTTRQTNEALADFKRGLLELPKIMQEILKTSGASAPGGNGEDLELGKVEIGAAGQKLAAATDELATAVVAALDDVEQRTAAAIDKINQRTQRGSLVNNAMG